MTWGWNLVWQSLVGSLPSPDGLYQVHVGVELTQLIRAREGILHLLQEVPDLSEEERAAAEGDQAMLERSIEKYRDIPPPPVLNERYRFNGRSSQRAVGKPLPILQKQA